MSPEIFKNKPYSFKSDIWALGCVLYEMTTLNHAFDANSLNGLATKIVKGKYPPVHAKYSKHLRELIGQMLLLNPQQRPDLDQILRKPFIKKHIINFFSDIASRPSASIGEGTMIMKAAAGAPATGVSNDTNMISLQKQLHSLNMSEELAEALKPKSVPVDDNEAIKLAKEQASALKREQEHKKMVESALEKLRLERENRMKEKKEAPAGPGLARPIGYPPAQGRGVAAAPSAAAAAAGGGIGIAGGGGAGGLPSNAVAPARQIPPVAVGGARPNYGPSPSQQPLPGMGGGAGGGGRVAAGAGGAVDPIGARNRRNDDDSNSVGSRKGDAARRRSFDHSPDSNNVAMGGGALAAERERKQRLLLQQQQQEAEAIKVRAEEQRKREEVRQEARAREEARLREEARQKEEAARKSQMEFAARRDALAQREKEREKERERQKEEIEQLKKDKLELDRRAVERDRVREERRAQERGRLEGDKFSNVSEPTTSRSSHGGGYGGRPSIAEEKSLDSVGENLSAKEKVYIRRQEKQAKEEAARMEALREAEAENRKIRQAAQVQSRHQYYASDAPSKPPLQHAPNSGGIAPTEDVKYEFDPRKPKNRGAMDVVELSDRLSDITKGKNR